MMYLGTAGIDSLLDWEGSRTPRMMEQPAYELWDTPIGAAFKGSRSSVCAPAVSSPAQPAGSEEGSPLQRSAHRKIDLLREPRNSGAQEPGRFPAAISAQIPKERYLGRVRERSARRRLDPLQYHPLTHSVEQLSQPELRTKPKPLQRPWLKPTLTS